MKQDPSNASREVFCGDALAWLAEAPELSNASLVTSLPDLSEFSGSSVSEWKHWFQSTAELILSKTPSSGVSIFFQSDIKRDGAWIDKGYLCQKAAEATGAELLWHKIICRAPAGSATFGRPGYSHILCFSRELRLLPATSTPDVLPSLGERTWERGMGLEACLAVATFIRDHTASTCIVNPFCGRGSMLAAANALGLAAIGIERSPKRAERARRLTLCLNTKTWQENLSPALPDVR